MTPRIGIIGGGLMGMALAERLAGPDRAITVFERDTQPGGLAGWQSYGDFYWDKFYHVVLPTDKELIGFIEGVGLGDSLHWKHTYTGYYVNRKFYSISTSMEFLLFPPLSMFSKFRLAMTLLLGARITDWKPLEQVTIESWLVKMGGRATFEKFWKPLLLAKLGENYRRVSAVFIWSYIKRLFEARDASSTARKEQMGYISGGYKTLFEHLEATLPDRGCTVRTGTSVERIEAAPDGGVWVTADGERQHFDKVIFTSPVNVLEQTTDASLVQVTHQGRQVEYLGVICMVLMTRKPFTPYYVLNLADDRVPFTGVIGMSTLVETEETGGHYMTYFPKYIISDDPMLREPESVLQETFLAGVRVMYPELKDEDIVSVHINRAIKVQPLQVLGYSEIVPQVRTQHPDFYVLNTSQFVHGTLNNNAVIQHVLNFVSAYGAEITQPAAKTPANI
ncbi:MAG: NAD(P)/FAD-dependent oxidoreductase [Bacteroidia bacterium]|nr:NAD(P)/FAD-dependent oxidoreductase [Bacteroidia bacterium]